MENIKLNLISVQFDYKDTHLSINKVENLDELVDQVTDDEFNKDERIPYWAELWPSAIGLSKFIIKNPELFYKKDILELGCGLGLTSLIIMQQKPNTFLCTDYENDALKLTRKNFLKNKINQPDFKYLDWRKPQLDEEFELIVASDVLYEKRFFQSMLNLFLNYLKRDGHIIIAEPNRKIAVPFFKQLKNHGYQYTIHFEEVSQLNQTIVISIYLIRRIK